MREGGIYLILEEAVPPRANRMLAKIKEELGELKFKEEQKYDCLFRSENPDHKLWPKKRSQTRKPPNLFPKSVKQNISTPPFSHSNFALFFSDNFLEEKTELDHKILVYIFSI